MSPQTVVPSVEALHEFEGVALGVSEWIDITQERIDAFADATDDHQWIHCDVERAKRESPFETTIAHGYLTLSLGPMLTPQVFGVSGITMGVNYGAGKIRFPSPVPVGSNLRLGVTLKSVDDIPGGAQVVTDFVFEVEGSEKPSCVAEVITRYYE